MHVRFKAVEKRVSSAGNLTLVDRSFDQSGLFMVNL